MSDTTKNEINIEQVCGQLKALRDALIGDEGEAVIVARMGNPAFYGDVGSDTQRWDFAPNQVFLVLEIPIGHDFPTMESENIVDGYTLMGQGVQ